MSAIPEDIMKTAEERAEALIVRMCVTMDHSFGLQSEQEQRGLCLSMSQIAYHDVRPAIAKALHAERERHGWQPICTFTPKPLGGSLTAQVMCAHAEKKWVRFGRYDLTLKRWYYSGTNERSQYAQVDGDAPTHWMPIPDAPQI